MKKGIFSVIIIFVLAAAGCASRRFIMPEKVINEIPKTETRKGIAYGAAWCYLHPVLLISEGLGARHDVHLENGDSFAGIKVINKGGRARLLVIISKEIDYSRAKAVISSRSGRHLYTVDGQKIYSNEGYIAPQFSWQKIRPLGESGIEIWPAVLIGTEKDKHIREILSDIGRQMDDQKIPGLFDQVMAKAAKITSEDIILAGATNFSGLFAVFGVRAWAIVELIVQKADLSLPYYDTAPLDRFQLAILLQPFQEQLNSLKKEQEEALEKWIEEMKEYSRHKTRYEADYRKWLENN